MTDQEKESNNDTAMLIASLVMSGIAIGISITTFILNIFHP